MRSIAVYPGTFDPMTYGHLDLVERSAAIFDHVIVAVASATSKATSMFDLAERMQIVTETVAHRRNVSVQSLDCLLVEFCRRLKVQVVIRGLRAYSDFEYEFQMALTNRKLAPEIETLFLMPQEEHSYVTASTVREVARYGGDTSGFVPDVVQQHIDRFLEQHPEQRLAARKEGALAAAARLIVDIPRLDEGGERYQGETPEDALDLDAASREYFQPVGGIRYDLVVQPVGPELLARGSASQRLSCVCARCATVFEDEVADPAIVVAVPLDEAAEFVDLTPELREAIIFALPSYPVCRVECQGLCPRCGANLNQGPCSCRPEDDKRWGALDGLDG